MCSHLDSLAPHHARRSVPLSSMAVVDALGTSRRRTASPRIAAAAAGHVGCLRFCTVMSTTAGGVPAVCFWPHTDAFPFGVDRGVDLVGEKARMCSVLAAPADCPAFGPSRPRQRRLSVPAALSLLTFRNVPLCHFHCRLCRIWIRKGL